MNIVFLAPVPLPDQLTAHPAPWITSLLDALSLNKNLNITVINCSHLIQSKIENIEKNNIKYVYLKTIHPKIDLFLLNFNKILTLNKYLRKHANFIDIIHIFGNEHQYEISTKGINIPKLLHTQGIISECRKIVPGTGFRYFSWLISAYYEKRGYKIIKNYSCRTHWDTAIVLKNTEKPRIFNIWEMIRPSYFKYTPRFNEEVRNILFLGGTNELKGLDTALKVISLLNAEGKNVSLLIGGNSKIDVIKTIILKKKLKIDLEKDLKILGFLDSVQMLEVYSQSFCLLHPTRIDNSPNSVCEAQVAGLPVIATNVGGVSSLIEHGKTGFLTSENPVEICEYVIKIMTDKETWNEISENSMKMARKRHDPVTIVNQTLAVYQELLKEKA